MRPSLRFIAPLFVLALFCVAAPAQTTGPHGTIHGKLTGADGAPITSAWVAAIPSEGEVPADNVEQLTKEDGTFTLDVPPGKYFVVANYDWPATEGAPVLTTYYPSVEKESEAKAITVADKAKLNGIDIHVTHTLVPKYIDVIVLNADGTPATAAEAHLTQTDKVGVAGNDNGVTYVDKDGKAHLLAFEGVDYLLFANLGVGAKRTCSTVVKLGKTTPTAPVTVKITLDNAACNAQENAARSVAYAAQAR
jgi:hypothetical protein